MMRADYHYQGRPAMLILRALITRLNGSWHKRALQAYLIVVFSHWIEHVLQAWQIYTLGWPRAEAGGALGLVFPWLVKSEVLHYAYALMMLVGLIVLRPGFKREDRTWWNVALALQVWHHVEHALLLGQVLIHRNLFGLPAPTSLAQLIVPRMELHLFYNAIVFTPMLVAMFYHIYPRRVENHVLGYGCSCARREEARPL